MGVDMSDFDALSRANDSALLCPSAGALALFGLKAAAARRLESRAATGEHNYHVVSASALP
jgi:hypothetical protein